MNRTVDARITLRAARSDELPAVEALLVENNLPVLGVADDFGDFIVAEHEGRIIGVTGLERCGDDGLLRSAVVASDWRGKGVGAALVERVIETAEDSGVRGLYLLTTTAERYFPAFGFTAVPRESVPAGIRGTSEFTTACPASAVVMARRP